MIELLGIFVMTQDARHIRNLISSLVSIFSGLKIPAVLTTCTQSHAYLFRIQQHSKFEEMNRGKLYNTTGFKLRPVVQTLRVLYNTHYLQWVYDHVKLFQLFGNFGCFLDRESAHSFLLLFFVSILGANFCSDVWHRKRRRRHG